MMLLLYLITNALPLESPINIAVSIKIVVM